jgi:hypothetical protein
LTRCRTSHATTSDGLTPFLGSTVIRGRPMPATAWSVVRAIGLSIKPTGNLPRQPSFTTAQAIR